MKKLTSATEIRDFLQKHKWEIIAGWTGIDIPGDYDPEHGGGLLWVYEIEIENEDEYTMKGIYEAQGGVYNAEIIVSGDESAMFMDE